MTQPATTEVPATPAVAGPGPYTITLPAGLRLLNSNQRIHRHEQARLTRALRAAAHQAVTEDQALMAALAAAKPGPLLERAHILAVYHPPTNGRRDPANYYPGVKAAVDGIVDAGLLDDDDHTHVVGPDMRLGAKRNGGQLVLIIRGLADGEDPLGGAVTR